MQTGLPHLIVPRGPLDWAAATALAPFTLADGGGAPAQATEVRLFWDPWGLHVRFECVDRDAWGTYGERDDPLYEQEAVEVFLAPGAADPVRYFEFEVSPAGALFDATIENPTSLRRDLVADPAWDCPEIAWKVGRGAARQDWWAELSIPWAGLGLADPPGLWRANFYRIERPRGGNPEFSAWSPTFTSPPDFHQPAWFGVLELDSPNNR